MCEWGIQAVATPTLRVYGVSTFVRTLRLASLDILGHRNMIH
jgi:hypothetical protein